jgi:hypothetical protein
MIRTSSICCKFVIKIIDMKPPFSPEQFFAVFEKYNLQVFPAQIFLMLFGLLALVLLHTKKKTKHSLIGLITGIFWVWTGLVYHMGFFAAINPIARIFGIIFMIQGGLIIMNAFMKDKFSFELQRSARSIIGELLIVYGLLIYPLISYLLAGNLQHVISVGLPCPTTIATFGFFMLAGPRFPRYLLIIPFLWAIVGVSAAINLGVWQDLMILVAALLSSGFILFSGKAKS